MKLRWQAEKQGSISYSAWLRSEISQKMLLTLTFKFSGLKFTFYQIKMIRQIIGRESMKGY